MIKTREAIDEQQKQMNQEPCVRCEVIEDKVFLHFNGMCDNCFDDMYAKI